MMANSPIANPSRMVKVRSLGPVRLILVSVLLALLALAAVFYWTTRRAMEHLSFEKTATSSLVDLRPWQTAQALAPLAVSAEENEFAREAERLADHEVDQAFAAALRQARLDAEHRSLNAEALALKQKIADLEQLRRSDQAQVDKLTAASKSATNGEESDDLQVARAQLGLDNDELADAQRDLERASGDNSVRIQDELNAHEESMKKYDAQVASGETAVISVARNRTLAHQIHAWFSQRQRYKLILQAGAQAQDDVKTITAEHNALEAKTNAAAASSGQTRQLQALKNFAAEREILSIDDDRIQTGQQLASIYGRWATQVQRQHRIVLHLFLGNVLLIVIILIATVVCDAIVHRVASNLVRDNRQMRTLRRMVEFGVQAAGVILVLLIVFGVPRETPTILGLTTAALTIALQDYIVAFLGWFTLMGKNGIHVGDWVEINGVGGEVVEFKLMTTTLLETGKLADPGHPTGRRITFMNSYAIRGKFFNFSTAGQWMWDEIAVPVPGGLDIHTVASQIQALAAEETSEDAKTAEREWRQAARDRNLARTSAAPLVSFRPAGAGIELELRYVTAAGKRFDVRNRLYRRVIELLNAPGSAAGAGRP